LKGTAVNVLKEMFHAGSAAGHYTSYAKNPQTAEWHYFNDDDVTKQKPQEEDYSNAYILFYQRQGEYKVLESIVHSRVNSFPSQNEV
jgi:hypothetical protein